MRFGIMQMQMQWLLPGGSATQSAAAQAANFDPALIVSRLAQAGFRLVELGGDLGMFFPQAFSAEGIAHLMRLKADFGLAYTVHLPLWSVEPSTPLTPVRQGSAQALIDVVRATLPLEPECYVLHATGALAAEFTQMRLPEEGKALILRQFQQGARQSIQRLLAETGLPGRKLALETIEFPFELTCELAETLDVSMCLDTGHVLTGFSGAVELFDVLERVLPRLGEIHLHDAPWQGPEHQIGYGKDHQALGRGDLDTGRLLDRLNAAGWTGPIIFELSLAEAAASLDAIRALRPAAIS